MGEIESALIAVVVSVMVSISVLWVKDKYFEPRKIKRQIKSVSIQKKIEAYGKLTALLGAAEEKGKDNLACTQSNTTHFLDHPKDVDKIKEIFENNYSIFPFELNNLYFKFEKEQKTFHSTSSYSGTHISYTICNLNEMQELAMNELVDNKEK